MNNLIRTYRLPCCVRHLSNRPYRLLDGAFDVSPSSGNTLRADNAAESKCRKQSAWIVDK